MRLFTKLLFSAALAATSLASAFATTITVTVGDNFYHAADGSTTITMTTADELVFSYATGNSSHPTMSDSSPAAWGTFPMDQNNRTKIFAANTFAVGTYPFHCTAHGAPGVGQIGTLVVTAATTTATAASRLATPVLNLFPNPSKGQVTLQLDQRNGQAYKLRLNNVIGQEVRVVALKPELLADGQTISLADLPNGIYFYSLLVNDKVVTTKRLMLQSN